MSTFQANSVTRILQKSNIKEEDSLTINEIKNNYNITIKEADKGCAIVVMNSTYYKNKVLGLLQEGDNYKEVSRNMDLTVINRIEKFSKKYKEELTDKEKTYIYKFDYKCSQFYGLPKIHKSTLYVMQ